MESFLGLEVEQGAEGISLHLDTYIQELVEEYRLINRKIDHAKDGTNVSRSDAGGYRLPRDA